MEVAQDRTFAFASPGREEGRPLPYNNVLLSPSPGKNSVGERKGEQMWRGKGIPAFCSLAEFLANQWNGEHIGATKGLIHPTLIEHGMCILQAFQNLLLRSVQRNAGGRGGCE